METRVTDKYNDVIHAVGNEVETCLILECYKYGDVVNDYIFYPEQTAEVAKLAKCLQEWLERHGRRDS